MADCEGAWKLGLQEGVSLVFSREISATEWVESVLARGEETEESYHAFAYIDREAALRQAALLDDVLRDNDHFDESRGTRPLLGAPVAVKDNIDVLGTDTRAGSDWFVRRPKLDAGVVRNLRSAGAVILGKTAMYEFGLGVGRVDTRSPIDPEFYAGGSSVGSAVSVALGSSAGSVGTDAGGSVRIPAAINGLYGFRPTPASVSRSGVVPMCESIGAVGPITRSLSDCRALFDGMRSSADDVKVVERSIAARNRIRIALIRQLFEGRGVDAAFSQIRDRLTECSDIEIVEIDVRGLDDIIPIETVIMLSEAAALHVSSLRMHGTEYGEAVRNSLLQGAIIPAVDYVKACRMREKFRLNLCRDMDDASVDFLLQPTVPTGTIRLDDMVHAHLGERSMMDAFVQHTFIASLCEFPALSIPVGSDGEGRPLALELSGAPGRDDGVFEAAERIADVGLLPMDTCACRGFGV